MHPLWLYSIEGGPRRVNHSAVLIDHLIYTFGGYCSAENNVSPYLQIDTFVFNTVSIHWQKVCYNKEQKPQDVPCMRYGHSSVAIGCKAYLFGGSSDNFGSCNKLYYFDTEKSLWTNPDVSGHVPGPRDGHGMCVARENIFVFGGYESQIDRFSEETFMLDMKSMKWALLMTKGQSGLCRDFLTLTANGDKIYLFGGRGEEARSSQLEKFTYDNDIKVLDLNTLVWSSAAKPGQKLPTGRRSHTSFFHKDCLFVFGGYNSEVFQHFNDLWKFDPRSGLWSEICTIGEKPCQRRRHCCCYLDNKAYFFGGTSPIPNQISDDDTDDLSDTHVLEFEPSLRSLCFHTILQNRQYLEISSLPISLRKSIKSMTTDSNISIAQKNHQG